MSVWRRTYRTNHRLWAVCSLFAFGVAGAMIRVPFGKGLTYTYWNLAWTAARHADAEFFLNAVVPLLIFWGLVLAVPAAGIGWIAQAVVTLIRPARSGNPDALG
jgi:hypothetical protein